MVGIRPFYLTAIAVAGLALGTWSAAEPTEVAPLLLEAKIPLGEVTGRIDHMTIDLPRHRVFVAELGNNTVGVVDLESRKVVQRLTRLSEPQGVGYVPANDTLYVANGGDGSVKIFRGPDYALAGRIDLGKDADNIRVDAATTLLYVGYGDGGIGVIDPQSNSKIKAFPLKAHPESFQLENTAGEMFVNLPNTRSIAVLNKKIGELPLLGRCDTAQILPWPSITSESAYSWCFEVRQSSQRSICKRVRWRAKQTPAATPMTCSSMPSASVSILVVALGSSTF